MTNHVDRFQAAVSTLAGDGHIKQRLIAAFQNNLADIEDNELPRAVRDGFGRLRDRLASVAPLNGEGPICASVRKMSVVEASECAVSVVSLYGEMLRFAEDPQPALPLDQVDEPVPPFLVKSVS